MKSMMSQQALNTQRRNKFRTSQLQNRYGGRGELTAPSAVTQTYAQIGTLATVPDAATTIKSQQSIFPFLKLPAELRILVYVELLISNGRLAPTCHGPRRYSWQQKTSIQPFSERIGWCTGRQRQYCMERICLISVSLGLSLSIRALEVWHSNHFNIS